MMMSEEGSVVDSVLRAYGVSSVVGGAGLAFFFFAEGSGFADGALAWLAGTLCAAILLAVTAPVSGFFLLWLGRKLAPPHA
jgi:hypothetical protein